MWIRKYPLMEEAGDGGSPSGGSGDGGNPPAGGDGGGDGGGAPSGDGGGDGGQPSWREHFAGVEDDKQKAWLERFTKPEDLLKTAWESQQRIRAGEVLKPLPEDATDEDIKAYREQQGIPHEAKGYFENLPDGLVVSEEDQPIFEKFAERLHSINAPPSVVHETIKWYNEFQQEQDEQLKVMDDEHAEEVSKTLRDEWGADYRKNMNIAQALLQSQHGLSEEARERFMNARTAEGKAFFNDPEIVKWVVGLGRTVLDDHTIVGDGPTDDKNLFERKAEIEAKMHTPEYNKNPQMQAEYQQILTVLDKRGKLDENGNVKAA